MELESLDGFGFCQRVNVSTQGRFEASACFSVSIKSETVQELEDIQAVFDIVYKIVAH
jgi:hypothetical protein